MNEDPFCVLGSCFFSPRLSTIFYDCKRDATLQTRGKRAWHMRCTSEPVGGVVMKILSLSTVISVLTAISACSTLEQSYENAMRKYDGVHSTVSDVRGIKSDFRYMKSKVERVAGR